MEPFINIGKVIKPHGLKGELKIVPYDREASALSYLETVYFYQENKYIGYGVKGNRQFKGFYLLTFEDIHSVESCQPLIKREVFAKRADLRPLPDGEYYFFDIIGLEVNEALTQEKMGRIIRIESNPAHDIYIVQQKDKEWLLPATSEAIAQIDLAQGVLVIRDKGFLF